MKKKLIALAMVVTMMFSMVGTVLADTVISENSISENTISENSVIVSEKAVTKIEATSEEVMAEKAGDSIATATSISFGTTYNGAITETSSADYYKFTTNYSGCLNLQATHDLYCLDYYLYDESGNRIWDLSAYSNGSSGISSVSEELYLTKGTYYFSADGRPFTGNYDFKLMFVNSGESFTETNGGSNNALGSANLIKMNATYKGQIAINDTKDFYKFTLNESGKVSLSATHNLYALDYYLYDESGNMLWDECAYSSVSSGISNMNVDLYLTKGIYYFSAQDTLWSGNYTFNLLYKSTGESFKEINGGCDNTLRDANVINVNTTYKGQIGVNDEADFYKFTIPSTEEVVLKINSGIDSADYYLFDAYGNCLWDEWGFANSNMGKYVIAEKFKLSAGTYYLSVQKRTAQGSYSFNITAPPAVGTVTVYDGVKYKVIKNGTGCYMQCIGPVSKNIKKATIKSYIYIGSYRYPVCQIKSNAFKGCKKLTKVVIGDNMKTIGAKVFYGCSKLKSITIQSKKLKVVKSQAFKGIHKKAKIKVPKSKMKKYKKLLKKAGVKSTATFKA